MKKTLSGKLLLMNLAVVGVALAIIALLLPQLISNYIFNQREREMTAQGKELARLTGEYLEGSFSEEDYLQLLVSLDHFLDARIWVVDREGEVTGASYGERPFRFGPRLRLTQEQVKQLAGGEIVTARRFVPHFDQVMLSVGVPVWPASDAGSVGSIFLHAPVTEISATVNNLLRYVLYSGLAAIALSSLLGYLFSKRLSRPLKEMAAAARRMGRGEYASRIKTIGEDELGQLAGSLNDLAGQLEQNISALEREKEKFESMVTAMQEGVVGVNHTGELIFMNSAAQKMLDLEQHFLGRPLEEVFSSEELIAPFTETLTSGASKTEVLVLEESHYAVRVSPVKDETGGASGAVGLIQDISEAARLEKMRRDFIANVSHELRTPLTVVRGYAEALLDGTAQPTLNKRYLETIRTEAERLNRLIDDLLDISRIQAGRLSLRKESFSLRETAAALTNQLAARLSEKNITVEADIPDLLQMVVGDRDRTHQMLLNLMDNALRFSRPGGKITVTAAPGTGQNSGKVCVSVIDNGPGIPSEELPHIWERFYRVEKSRDRKLGGTGLGLAIVKEIIEAHGESITVESGPGSGTIFTFTLPRAGA